MLEGSQYFYLVLQHAHTRLVVVFCVYYLYCAFEFGLHIDALEDDAAEPPAHFFADIVDIGSHFFFSRKSVADGQFGGRSGSPERVVHLVNALFLLPLLGFKGTTVVRRIVSISHSIINYDQ